MDWDNVRYFLEVVNQGSLAGAARHLGVNQTTVSRRITALEQHLGKQLFERTANGFVITPIAEQLVATASRMSEEASSLERHVMADSHELSGALRITVADACTQQLALPAIQAFSEQYPDVDITIIATRDLLDLTAREADVALRSTDEPPPNLVGKRIGRLAYAIYGSREWLERIEAGTDAEMLSCITWAGDGHSRPAWIDKNFPGTRRIYRSTELGIMHKLVRAGLGIAQIPCALGDPDPALQRLPGCVAETGWGLWVLSHVDLRSTARVRIFRDLLVSELEQQRALIEGKRGA